MVVERMQFTGSDIRKGWLNRARQKPWASQILTENMAYSEGLMKESLCGQAREINESGADPQNWQYQGAIAHSSV